MTPDTLTQARELLAAATEPRPLPDDLVTYAVNSRERRLLTFAKDNLASLLTELERLQAVETAAGKLAVAAETLMKRSIINILDSAERPLYPDWLGVSTADRVALRSALSAYAQAAGGGE